MERAAIRLCRDEDCPECGWPETYSEVYPSPVLLAIGCNKCGWSTRGDEERRQLIRDEIDRVEVQMQCAAAAHQISRYDQLTGRIAALRWCLGIEEVVMIELARR